MTLSFWQIVAISYIAGLISSPFIIWGVCKLTFWGFNRIFDGLAEGD
jgi:hypothetical protein